MITAAEFAAIQRTDCHHCGAPPDRPCDTTGGFHFMRVQRAWRLGWIGDAPYHAAMYQAVVFNAASVLHLAVIT